MLDFKMIFFSLAALIAMLGCSGSRAAESGKTLIEAKNVATPDSPESEKKVPATPVSADDNDTTSTPALTQNADMGFQDLTSLTTLSKIKNYRIHCQLTISNPVTYSMDLDVAITNAPQRSSAVFSVLKFNNWDTHLFEYKATDTVKWPNGLRAVVYYNDLGWTRGPSMIPEIDFEIPDSTLGRVFRVKLAERTSTETSIFPVQKNRYMEALVATEDFGMVGPVNCQLLVVQNSK